MQNILRKKQCNTYSYTLYKQEHEFILNKKEISQQLQESLQNLKKLFTFMV